MDKMDPRMPHLALLKELSDELTEGVAELIRSKFPGMEGVPPPPALKQEVHALLDGMLANWRVRRHAPCSHERWFTCSCGLSVCKKCEGHYVEPAKS